MATLGGEVNHNTTIPCRCLRLILSARLLIQRKTPTRNWIGVFLKQRFREEKTLISTGTLS
jgi:hypothetical protein